MNVICISLIFIISIPIFSKERDTISGRSWVREFSGNPGIEINFNKDGTFSAIELGEGIYQCNKGYYSVNKDVVNFKSICCSKEKDDVGEYGCWSESKENKKLFNSLSCIIKNSNKSLRFEKYLDCHHFIVWDQYSVVKPGSIKNLNGIKIKVKKVENGNIIKDVKIFTIPSLNSKPFETVKKNYSVRIFAETISKDDNSKMYYVEVDHHIHSEYGWIISDSVEIVSEEK